MTIRKNDLSNNSRRDFIKKSMIVSAGISAGLFNVGNPGFAQNKDKIRVGLIGCGSRGSGAVRFCLSASENVELTAMGDLFEDRLQSSLSGLQQALGEKINVPEVARFTGLDAYKKVIESNVDLVMLTTPPGFRPEHFREAVENDKHVFMEKPIAVDPVGVRSVIKSGELAAEKNLSVMSGLQYRKKDTHIHAMEEIHNRTIGMPIAANAEYLMGNIWYREREPEMSEMEWQLRNWYYYTWLSGDFIVEQFIHNLDIIIWAMGALPESCTGMGARQKRTQSRYGNIYDQFSLEYEFPREVKVSARCRQMDGTWQNRGNSIIGTDGKVEITPNSSVVQNHGSDKRKRYEDEGESPHIVQQRRLIESIRNDSPVNETQLAADATLMAVMGREAAYTGQMITWEEIKNSNLDLTPANIDMSKPLQHSVPEPGITQLERTQG